MSTVYCGYSLTFFKDLGCYSLYSSRARYTLLIHKQCLRAQCVPCYLNSAFIHKDYNMYRTLRLNATVHKPEEQPLMLCKQMTVLKRRMPTRMHISFPNPAAPWGEAEKALDLSVIKVNRSELSHMLRILSYVMLVSYRWFHWTILTERQLLLQAAPSHESSDG